ncbi:MAG: uroporphyrinogen-III synthase [Flavobacteriaceae bacterium]
MTKVLSTKILSPKLKKIVESQGITLMDYNAIHITFRKFTIDPDNDYYIFTSQNAVRGFLRAYDNLPLPEKRKEALSKSCFCVGNKTSKLLDENGLKVIKTAKNSKELADFIVKNHQNASFSFICGNRRRAELPSILIENTVRYREVIAYDTLDNVVGMDRSYDGVLFFSPSAVQSYTSVNELSGNTAFCIGESTAREASKHTGNIVISKHQSIENVLESVVEYYHTKLDKE